MEKDPPKKLDGKETTFIKRFCPILLLQANEPFPLKDFVAIHHPEKPLIGYHLFWEDDYDFPNDNEPSDHEEVWVEYDAVTERIKNIYTWFHSRIIESKEAVIEANDNDHRLIIRIKWGKHGSLLKGWEKVKDPYSNITLKEWMEKTYERMKLVGRAKDHPLKAYWPKAFEGSLEEYL